MSRDRTIQRKLSRMKDEFFNQFAREVYIMPFGKRLRLCFRILFKAKNFTV